VKVAPDTLLPRLRLLVLPLQILSVARFRLGIGCTFTLMVLGTPEHPLAVAVTKYPRVILPLLLLLRV
jgi:hypothetical protein